MRRIFYLIFGAVVLLPTTLMANTGASAGIDASIESKFAPIAAKFFDVVFAKIPFFGEQVPLILIWLVAASVFCTFYFRFINIRGFKHAFRLVRGDYDNPKDPGTITHFQALATELSGTVGLGNIAGVAIAISLGGPGATLWMILAGFFGMSTKFAECTLGVKYRYIGEGRIHGGPMYYLRDGFAEKGMPTLGKILGVIFAIASIGGAIGATGMFQANQSFIQFMNMTGGEAGYWGDKGWLFGLIFASLVAAVIIGGIRSIAAVASAIVPLMTTIYISACLVVIGVNYAAVGGAMVTIAQDAFGLGAFGGGMVGAFIAGIQRAAFSNEAGFGSAAVAHAAVKTKDPATEGYVAMIGPFFDTIIVCTLTALVIVTTGVYKASTGISGVELTSNAFETAISWFPYVLTVAVLLFAFSSVISWAYYASKSVNFLFEESRTAELVAKLMICVFIVIGTSANLESVITFSDALIFTMAVPNIIGIYVLAPVVKKELKTYQAKIKKLEQKKKLKKKKLA